ncbi:MAG: GTP-binding protein, partial [Alphaproteobacteria bacterium]|nr:GTP-binding protein [Alphaproteobacteria bacterium]
HLQALVAVVDAPNGARNLASAPEAREQVALADRIVLTKSDIAEAAATQALASELALMTAAPVERAVSGAIDPSYLLDERLDLSRGLGAAAHAHDHAYGHAHAHSDGIESFVLTFDRPLAWPAFEQAMAVLTALRGPDVLRVKGIVAVDGTKGPVVVHAVQHTAHRPVELEAWPDGDRASRLVFITRGIGKGEVEALLAAVAALAPPNGPGSG